MLKFSRYGINLARSLSASSRSLASSATLTSEKTAINEAQKVSEKLRKQKSPKVAAVFASLKEDDQVSETTISSNGSDGKPNIVDEAISNAKTVNGLLSIADAESTKNDLSRNHALKIVSILAEWSSINKAKLSEFENDSRFVKLCKVLGRSIRNNPSVKTGAPVSHTSKLSGFRTEDLKFILGVTGDDESARMVAKLSLQQMVKVLKNLAMKKRRSIPLLRSLTFNMSSNIEHLDMKQCGDVLYSLATLNYPDQLSIKKVCVDIQEAIKSPIRKSSAIGSVLTSLALLKYRDTLVLDVLTEWIVKNQESSRTQDLSATVMSLALLNYTPEELRETLRTKLSSSLADMDFKNSFEFLNYCWSLMSLGFYHEKYFNTVLSPEFVQRIKSECFDNELTPGIKMKLLNINGGVKLFLPNYNGSMLDREKLGEIYDVPLIHNKEKQMIVSAMNDSLKSLVPNNCQKLNQNTNMGFLIDAEFFVEKNGKPCEKEKPDGKRVAVIIHDFHDHCHGPNQELNGISKLNLQLLEKSGYTLVSIPYNEFSHNDKLLKRVQYLEERIKNISGK